LHYVFYCDWPIYLGIAYVLRSYMCHGFKQITVERNVENVMQFSIVIG